MKIYFAAAALILIIILYTASGGNGGYRRFQTQMAGYFDSFIIFAGYAESEEEFERYAAVLFDKLGELHRLYDIFNPYEGVNNLYTVNAHAGIGPVEVEQPVIGLLTAAKEAYIITEGMTTVAMGPVLRIWHEYRRLAAANPGYAALPSMDKLAAANKLTNIDDILIDKENGTVFLRLEGMSLDVGAIAKGYAAGLAMQEVIAAGMPAALLSAGGHVVAHGHPPGRSAWNVGIQNPDTAPGAPQTVDTVVLAGGTLSVSGDYERFFGVGDRRFGHIIDPATLMPPYRFRQVAVWHENSWMADVISTALFILTPEEGMRMAEKHGAEALWIDAGGEWLATSGYKNMSSVFGGK